MIARIVHLFIDKKNEQDFLDMFSEKKQLIRNFEGCHYLNLLSKDHGTYVQFSTFSHWRSQKDLDKYREGNVFGQVWPQTKQWMVKKPQAESFELVENLN